ncbi:hypothetical protein ACWER6_09915 [Streptomyces sp. NPDC004009]
MAHGAPAPVADLMLSIFAAAREGEFSAVEPTLAELIARAPAAFGTLLERAWAERTRCDAWTAWACGTHPANAPSSSRAAGAGPPTVCS